MNITMVDRYDRRKNKIWVVFQVDFDTVETCKYGKEYSTGYIFTQLRYNSEWILENKHQHDTYIIPNYSEISNEALINCLTNSETYDRIKSALKIKEVKGDIKMVTIYEQCAFCDEENEFEFNSVETINYVQTCKCGEQLVLCSECNHENCFSCKDGCNFKLREEWL